MFRRSGWASMLMIPGLVRWLRVWRPDVVHLSKPIGVPGLFLAQARGLGRWPARVMLDCDDLEWPWRGNRVAQWGVKLWERWAWAAADGVTVASHALGHWISGVRPPKSVVYLPNPVPQDVPPWQGNASPWVVVPTRLMDVSPERLGAWLRAVCRAVPEARIALVGPHGSAVRTWFMAARRADIAEKVTVWPWQRSETYYQRLAQARVAFLPMEPSLIAQAKCPARLLDLLAVGVPTVAVEVGEAPHLLADAGDLVPPAGEAIAAAIHRLWHDTARRQMFHQRARARAQTFAPERLAWRLQCLYISGGIPWEATRFALSGIRHVQYQARDRSCLTLRK